MNLAGFGPRRYRDEGSTARHPTFQIQLPVAAPDGPAFGHCPFTWTREKYMYSMMNAGVQPKFMWSARKL